MNYQDICNSGSETDVYFLIGNINVFMSYSKSIVNVIFKLFSL